MKKIVEKIEKKGYKEDKELALNTYNEIRTSIRHEENLFTALLSILTASLILSEKLVRITIEIVLAFVIIWSVYRYFRTIKLLNKLTLIIIEDPMDENEKEAWITIMIIIFSIMIVFIVSLFL